MQLFTEWVTPLGRFLAGIGPENLGLAVVAAVGFIITIARGLRGIHRAPPMPVTEPLSKRLDRMEHEYQLLEERQMMSDSRIAHCEGEVNVLRAIVVGGHKE